MKTTIVDIIRASLDIGITSEEQIAIRLKTAFPEKDIYKMMSSDLYFWYEQRLREDYNTLIELVDSEPEAEPDNKDEAKNEPIK